MGPDTAPVTIVEFSSLQCVSCASLATSLRALRDRHGDAIRIVWKNKPLSSQPAAIPAAEAALELRSERGDAAFWQMHDRLFDPRVQLVSGVQLDISAVAKIASALGADASKVRDALAAGRHRRQIDVDVDLAEDFEVESTPALFINGRKLDGVPTPSVLEGVIQEELAKAKAVLARGTPARDVYQTLVALGAKPWHPQSKPLGKLPAGPAIGAAHPKVTVHVFSDYQCALCVAVESAIADLRHDYSDEVRFVWHDLPLERHRDARRLAVAAREALAQRGVSGFWTLHDKIAYAALVPSTQDLDDFAGQMRLNLPKWHAALDGEGHVHELEADELAARDYGITETPAFLVVAARADRGTVIGHMEYGSRLRRVVEAVLEENELGAACRGGLTSDSAECRRLTDD